MDWWSKTKRWTEAHKNWLIFTALFIMSYLLGKKSNKNYLEMANLAKDQYKKENEQLIRQEKLKQMRDNTAKRKAEKVKKALEEEKDKRLSELENKSADIDSVFSDMGIKKK